MSEYDQVDQVIQFVGEPLDLADPIKASADFHQRATDVLSAAAERVFDIQTDPDVSQRDASEAAWLGEKIKRLSVLAPSLRLPERGEFSTTSEPQFNFDSFLQAQETRADRLGTPQQMFFVLPSQFKKAFQIASELSQMYGEHGARFEDFNLVRDEAGKLAVAYTASSGISLGSWNSVRLRQQQGLFNIGNEVDTLRYTNAAAYLAIERAQTKLGENLDERDDWFAGPGRLLLTGASDDDFRGAFEPVNSGSDGVYLFVGPPGVARCKMDPEVESSYLYVRPYVPLDVYVEK